ncbi:MAG TPA: ABC transporter permease [Phycisphaerae bacterium]|nr:ABC transporter permease [Phycisphaerae bacterium]
MSDPPGSQAPKRAGARAAVESLGRVVQHRTDKARANVSFVGGLAGLLGTTARWCYRGLFVPGVKLRRPAVAYQMVRVGIKAVPIVVLVQIFIGIILALQMAPTLESYGQIERVADIIAIAIVRELGPLITAIVLSGFAGASIAAEIGAMVESEEIKALRAHALNPFHFLVVPRFLATVTALVGLAVIADVVGVFGGFMTSLLILDVPSQTYIDLTREALDLKDFITGLVKAGVFGVLISMIACYQGLNARGGAEGVGRATTGTVVKCIVALIGTDAVFTAVFYVWGI